MPSLNVVLFQPEIPQNTGNIARTCAAVGAALHLIRPLGFFLRDRHLKRAGLDYWNKVDIKLYDSLEDFFETFPGGSFAFITKFGGKTYEKIPCSGDLFLIFGRETEGLPSAVREEYRDQCYRIPMKEEARSLNLANSVAIVVYEALRRRGFGDLSK